jgi:hypothetical protein
MNSFRPSARLFARKQPAPGAHPRSGPARGLAASALLAFVLSACGGGDGGGSTSSTAGSGSPPGSGSGSGGGSTTPTLSSAQSAYESVALASNGGLHTLLWNLPASGLPSGSATPAQFIVDISSGGLKTSPLTGGAQPEAAAWTSLSALSVPELPLNLPQQSQPSAGPAVRLPTMVVQASTGAVFAVSSDPTDEEQVSYVGSNIQIDTLATDNHTVAYSTTVSGVTPVSVAGQSLAAPTDATLTAWLSAYNLSGNSALLKSGASFGSGSEYLKMDATWNGNALFIADCALAQTSTSPADLVPCNSATTLSALTSEINYSDGTAGQYKDWNLQSDGQICTPPTNSSACPDYGVTYWVAATPRTTSMNEPADTSGSYRAYIELNGNIYVGELIRGGAPVWQNLGTVAHPLVQPFYLGVNAAFMQSVKGALTF